MAKKFKSSIFQTVHEGVSDLYESGFVDKATMREFDKTCLTVIEPMGADEIKALREREQVSQTVLAIYLHVSVNTVGQWERGERKPAGPSLKLLNLVKAKGLHSIQ